MSVGNWVLDPVTQVELEVPIYATPESTIARSVKRRNGELRTIRVFPDVGHEWPLWEPGSDIYAIGPEDLPISEGLAGDLRVWYDDWEMSFSRSFSWSSDAEAERWRQRGDVLLDRLQQELWLQAEVVGTYRSDA